MKDKTNIFIVLCCISLILIVILNIDIISNFIATQLQNNPKLVLENKNEYYKDDNFEYVQLSKDFIPYSIQDIKNIIYTAVNSGWRDFTFYCPKEYTSCIDDATNLTEDQEIMTHINNFVHPYNSFSNIKTIIDENGEVNFKVNFLYSKEQIEEINDKVDEIINNNVKDDMDMYDKIKAVHDYLINNSKYDVSRNNNNESEYTSFIAYGPLIEGYATCNGYTDAMAIFLTRFGLKNYKIATTPEDKNSTGHIWNAVYYDNKWVHLDATWDDPVSKDGKDYLLHKYFLVNNTELKEADKGEVEVTEHNYLKYVYSEFKEDPTN